jgi:hypothetical protein
MTTITADLALDADLTLDAPAPAPPQVAAPPSPRQPPPRRAEPELNPLAQESLADDHAPGEARGGAFAVLELLLRDRPALLERIERGEGLLEVSRTALLTATLCAAVFGAAVGMSRGGEQIAYAAVKLPLVMILTAALSTPAIIALRSVFQRQLQIKRDVALVLCALALSTLVLAGLAPTLPLLRGFEAGYHQVVFLTVACCALSGLVGLHFFAGGFMRWVRHERLTMAVVLLSVFALVGTQMTWTLRPWVVRPKTEEVPFVRALEGNFLEAVSQTSRSMMGIYAADAPSDRSAR